MLKIVYNILKMGKIKKNYFCNLTFMYILIILYIRCFFLNCFNNYVSKEINAKNIYICLYISQQTNLQGLHSHAKVMAHIYLLTRRAISVYK